MSDTQTHREAITRRVRALLSKTVENGASEHEALAAAEKARAIMDAHRLTMTDLDIKSEPIEQVTWERPNELKLSAVDNCLHGIDDYCGVKSWFRKSYNTRRVVCLGLTSDVQMAHYLYDLIAKAIERDTEQYRDTVKAIAVLDGVSYDRSEIRAIAASFSVGMAHRINARLHEMARALEPVAKTASGTALVVVKNALVKDAFDALDLKFRRGPSGMQARNYNSYSAGKEAGNRVNLSRPISNDRKAALR